MKAVNTTLTLAQALAPSTEPSRIRQFVGSHFVSPFEVSVMRDWLSDCAVEICRTSEEMEDNLAVVATASPESVLRMVAKTYAGGIAGFLGDGPEEDILSV